ncbi:MAG: insulinase family protein [Candidatus Caldatribacterium sp.]|nr:insulinase family protein [Candidatus Caldatribacterium sp.]
MWTSSEGPLSASSQVGEVDEKSFRVEKRVFRNGLTLLFIPRESELVVFHLLLGLGNIFERKEERGISALLQEALLKGTKQKSGIEFSRAVEHLGATFESSSNYFTGKVVMQGPAEVAEDILALFLEAIKTPAFLPEEVEKEKCFLIDLLRALDDDPLKAAMLRFKRAFFGRHPYAFPTLGEIRSLERMTQEQVVSWYERTFVPNNMVLAVAGKFNKDRMEKILERELGSIIPREFSFPSRDRFFPASLKIVDCKEVRDSWVVLGFRAPGILEVKDRVAFDVLNNVLGGGMYSRLFTKIRENRGLSYQVGSVYVPLLGPSFICAYCGFAPCYFDTVVGILREEFRNLLNLGEEEFSEAKAYTRGLFLHSFESVASLAALFAFYERIGLGWEFPFQYEAMLRELSLEEAKAIYRKFVGQGESLGAIMPVA